MTNEHSIAFKYAKALFAAAEENGVLEEVGDDAAKILDVLNATPEFDAFLKNPAALEKDTVEALRLLFHDSLGDVFRRFLALLAKNKRIALLAMILKRFERFREEAVGVLRVRLEYAGTLSEESKTYIAAALRRESGDSAEVLFEEVANPSLISGVRLIAGGRLYENSAKASLKSLRERLLASVG